MVAIVDRKVAGGRRRGGLCRSRDKGREQHAGTEGGKFRNVIHGAEV